MIGLTLPWWALRSGRPQDRNNTDRQTASWRVAPEAEHNRWSPALTLGESYKLSLLMCKSAAEGYPLTALAHVNARRRGGIGVGVGGGGATYSKNAPSPQHLTCGNSAGQQVALSDGTGNDFFNLREGAEN